MNVKKINNLCLSVGLSSVLFLGTCITTSVPAFAAINNTEISIESSSSNVDEEKLNEKLEDVQSGLINYLENLGSSVKNSPSIDVSSYFDNLPNEKKITEKETSFMAAKGNKINKKMKSLGYSKEKREKTQVVKTIKTKNNLRIDFYNNGIFSVENENLAVGKSAIGTSYSDVLGAIGNKNLNLSASYQDVFAGTVWGQAYRDYHSYLGNTIFSVAVGCGFKYDGSTADYYSNFTAYYKKGAVTSWTVSDWDSDHESDGDDYVAWCQGNFSLVFSVSGNNVTIDDMCIRHTVTCDPDGQVLRESGEI